MYAISLGTVVISSGMLSILTAPTTFGNPTPARALSCFRPLPAVGHATSFYEATGGYGPVLLQDNLFETSPGAKATVQFLPRGHDISVENNAFRGQPCNILVPQAEFPMGFNSGGEVEVEASFQDAQ